MLLAPAPVTGDMPLTLPATLAGVPRRMPPAIAADIDERFLINCVVDASLVRQLVRAPFLEPVAVDGKHLLCLCLIRMRHAAPVWLQLGMGPASANAAIRVACRDLRDDSPAVWVDHRYTDASAAGLLRLLGFPAVRPGLHLHGSFAGGGMHLCCGEAQEPEAPAAIDCLLAAGDNQWQDVFSGGRGFDAFIAAGVRSYGPGAGPGRFDVLDLMKEQPSRFSFCAGWGGYLQTAQGFWPIDGIYRTGTGRYCWYFRGSVNAAGDFLPTT